MKERFFLEFSKKHIILYLVLLLIPILIIGMVLVVATVNKYHINFEMWINILMGSLTYIGSTLLGIIVYYNSWLTERRKKSFNYNLQPIFNIGNKVVNFFSEENVLDENLGFRYRLQYGDYFDSERQYRYVAFSIVNYNENYPLKIKLDKVEFCKDNRTEDCTDNIKIMSKFNIADSLDYKLKNKIFIGINDEVVSQIMRDVDSWLNCRLRFYVKLSNSAGANKFLILTLQGSGLSEEQLSRKKYEKTINKEIEICNILIDNDFLSDEIK